MLRLWPMLFCVCVPTLCVAQDELEWSKFHECLDANIREMEQAETSLKDGADILVNVICNNQSAELAEKLVQSRQDVVQKSGQAAAASAFLRVMIHTATLQLFEARKLRLGI